MKCFERLVTIPIILETLETHSNVHTAPTDPQITQSQSLSTLPLEKNNTYVRMLFIDYSSAFHTIVPTKLITKLRTLGLNTLCN
jgi:gmma-aminobutyric acid receptor subunit gamma/cGMP-dependent protein kinase 2